ncbi:hypothetical protein CAEBREN_08688 [Caenorhabditis brenneri]|uniref:F-box domain-containing protein n=1 Tax=Caenorhabditis brenneri TaxID=135651 RepID=G0MGT4_CAEBE|nr:hypothetical protein CAEBREN_08688 [Caenorhabditis brenneri]
MADIFRSNRDAFRGAILFQIKLKVSVEEAFKSAKIVLEDDELDFVEFEYMYYKLYEDPLANFSADFTNKAPYSKLDTFPLEILEKIVHDLDQVDKFRARKVSTWFRNATLKAPCKYDKLEIEQMFNRVMVDFNGDLVIYKAQNPQGCKVKRTVFLNDDYFDMFSMDLNVILSNPNFCTDYFSIELHNELWGTQKTVVTTLENTITNCNLKFTARELNVSVKDGQHLRQIGNMFNTTALEKVTVKFNSYKSTLNLDVFNQFEQLKSIRIKSHSLCEMNSFELFAKCENFDMECQFRRRYIPNIVNQILVSDKFKRGCMCLAYFDDERLKTFFPDAVISEDTWYLKFKNIPFWLKLWTRGNEIMFLERCTEDDLP